MSSELLYRAVEAVITVSLYFWAGVMLLLVWRTIKGGKQNLL
jgi:hypothetical protein